MTGFFNLEQSNKIVSIALKAGEIAALAFKEKNFTITKKADTSQVTSADIAVSKFLHKELTREFPQIPVICEEGDLRDISGELFFLIDPIDGTSSFVSNSPEFAVNIALVKNSTAIFGLIYAPVLDGGKMIFSNHENRVILRHSSGEEVEINPANYDMSSLRIVTSARTKESNINKYIAQIYPDLQQNFSVERISSAIKFMHLLEGKSNLYLHFRPSMEWDTAAGQALVELINGKVKTIISNQEEISFGESLNYRKTGFTNSGFVATIFDF